MKIFRFAILALLPLLLCNCSDRGEEPVADPEEAAGTFLRLTLAVKNNPQARVTPPAGEDGDGREDGINNENILNNIAVFIYDDGGDGLDSDPSTPIIASGYTANTMISENNGEWFCTVPLKDYKPANTHRAVVVANAGDITSTIKNLADLRKPHDGKAWKPATKISATSNFLMASAFNGAKRPADDDGRVRIMHTDKGSVDNPNFAASVSLERVAARIDIAYPSGFNATSGLSYKVKSNKGSTLFITSVLPINLMQQASYTLKHVTEGFDTSSLLVCGDETAGPDNVATNYVIDPLTLSKTAQTASPTLAEWYGTTAAHLIRNNSDAFGSAIQINTLYSEAKDVPKPTDENNKFVIISYANENTLLPEAHSSRFITGLAFKAIYRPMIYHNIDLTNPKQAVIAGETFFAYRKGGQEMGEDYTIYFASRELAEQYKALHPEHLATIQEYPGGICYYNLWIRHAGDLCAIVRNNIYRISLSFTGPGTPTPELTEPQNVQSTIFVRHWNFRPQSEILM